MHEVGGPVGEAKRVVRPVGECRLMRRVGVRIGQGERGVGGGTNLGLRLTARFLFLTARFLFLVLYIQWGGGVRKLFYSSR
jgi:hypothetical protein